MWSASDNSVGFPTAFREDGDVTSRRLTAEQRRMLDLLASSRNGINVEMLVLGHRVHRFTVSGLVRRGLVAARREVMMAGSKMIEVVRVRITAVGRRAIGTQGNGA
jgi:hypothetical protein